jgi:hypothetical protein
MPLGGTLRNLKITLNTAPGTGKSHTFTLQRNSIDTAALTVTISDSSTAAELTGVDVPFCKYSTLSLRTTSSGSPASSGFSYCIECETAQANSSIYAGGRHGADPPSSVGSTGNLNPFFPANADWNSTSAIYAGRVGANGAITELLVVATGLDGTGAYEVALYKDAGAGYVKQDGTGGTVDTVLTVTGILITGSAALGSSTTSIGRKTFSLPVSVGDMVYAEIKGTVSGGLGGSAAVSTLFRATTNGEFILDGYTTSPGNTNFHPANDNTDAASSTEADEEITIGTLSNSLQITGVTWR